MKIALNEKQAGIIILVLHIVGMIGYMIDFTRPYFLIMTPFNLLITAGLLIYLLKPKDRITVLCLLSVYMIGFLAEYLGVNYNLIFGSYFYGDTLGPQISEVPIMIGVNWLILSLSCATLANRITDKRVYIIIMASIFMVTLDFLIEPVATHFDYWYWSNSKIPISNYIGWFGVALIIQFLLTQLNLEKIKGISLYIVVGQATFFISLNIYLQYI